MRHEQATITALFTMALECRTTIAYKFLKYDGDTHTHLFDNGDVFAVTVFAQVRMRPHNAPNEARGEGGGITSVPASMFIEWEFANISYQRHDGVVLIPADDLRGDFAPLKFVRVYDTDELPFQRTAHLCAASCWYGEACKLNLARTQEEVEAISF